MGAVSVVAKRVLGDRVPTFRPEHARRWIWAASAEHTFQIFWFV
ncbi:MAG TPA: hypothetical protein VKD45_05945 [Hyphomicrobiaceae bacterium]|nr:hypothetical protein [Hyphomicrobiaceae bacterium]